MPGAQHKQDRSADGAYGARLGDIFQLQSAPTFVNRSLKAGLLAITEIRDDAPAPMLSQPLPVEDAFLATFHVKPFLQNKCWEDGRMAPILDIRQGGVMIRDLRRNPSVLIDQPHHSLHFYIPRAAFDMIADQAEARPIGDLSYQPGVAVEDAIVGNIAGAVLAALRAPGEANRMFLDHVTMAVATHVAEAYGGLAPRSREARGGLSPHQERRAKELMLANLDGAIGVEVVARACGLSPSHFRRAFRQSTGLAPHQWLLHQRVEHAKTQLRDPRLSLGEVALGSGFADQSHFTRVFSGVAGVSPGRWRRDQGVAVQADASPPAVSAIS